MPNLNNTAKVAVIGAGATLILIGAAVYSQLDNWLTPEPTGPGSGDEIVYEEPTGPGSGDEVIEPTGPGSGDEVQLGDEPTGPGSGDEVPAEPEGPGSGDEVTEPTGPGSGDEMPTEPTGPGSGDEIDPNEPTGPGSGDEMPGPEPAGPGSGDEYSVIGSCNAISFGSICTDYIGSYWATVKDSILTCSNVGVWSDNPCPTNYQGGCNTNTGTPQENIIWYYNYGGDPFDAELTGYAQQGCAVNPFGTWVSGN